MTMETLSFLFWSKIIYLSYVILNIIIVRKKILNIKIQKEVL